MKLLNSFKEKSLKVEPETFESVALDLFQYQAIHCGVYQKYMRCLNRNPESVNHISEIPYLPIDFFKYQKVKTGEWDDDHLFMSSGTTMNTRSVHHIEDVQYYLDNAKSIFEGLQGKLTNHLFFALLPSYQEQGHSSLIKMVDCFINESGQGSKGGFYLNQLEELISDLIIELKGDKSVVLFGVGYALLDLVELAKKKKVELSGLTIIETGGMKGRRKDMVKHEFYSELKEGFGNVSIYSEYGMTELLSQAYSFNENTFQLPTQMKVLIRDPEDPFALLRVGQTGGVNVIDLANVHSCAFIETKDLGRLSNDGQFEILGRLDNSDIRGCNLLVE